MKVIDCANQVGECFVVNREVFLDVTVQPVNALLNSHSLPLAFFDDRAHLARRKASTFRQSPQSLIVIP
jgi:hypothetical protein